MTTYFSQEQETVDYRSPIDIQYRIPIGGGGWLDLLEKTIEQKKDRREAFERELAAGRRQRFSRLAEEWRNQNSASSFIEDLVIHSAYQEIIGMGPAALPYIFEEMEQRLDHWFWALRAITGVNPVPSEYAGNLPNMTKAWLDWGSEHGYH